MRRLSPQRQPESSAARSALAQRGLLALFSSLLAAALVACQAPAPARTISIDLRNGAPHLLEGKPVTEGELEVAFAEQNKPAGSVQLTIRADNKTISYASIVKVVQAAEKSGIRLINLVEVPAE